MSKFTVMLRLNAPPPPFLGDFSINAPSNRRPPKNSKNLINAPLAVDGTEDDLIRALRKVKNAQVGELYFKHKWKI